jgi:hypothetical protein
MYSKISPEVQDTEDISSSCPLLPKQDEKYCYVKSIHLQEIAINHLYPTSLHDVIAWPSAVLARFLREECQNKPPSLENLLVWAKENSLGPLINPPEYIFISHMHDNAFPNKLGPGQIEAICSISGNIWLDLTSMYQGCWGGYEYTRHTKPIVERLHEIMLGSTAQAVVLSGYDTDPMRISPKLNAALATCRLILQYDFFTPLHEKLCDGHLTSFVSKVDNAEALLNEVELPIDRYFSRLWCYVERLAVHGNEPDYVLNGKGGKNLTALVEALANIQSDLKLIADHFHFPMDETITVFKPFFYNKRFLVYGIRGIEGVLSTIRKLWGIEGSRLEGSLDPWSSVETLDCYCDADRVIVYSIECSLRGIEAKPVEYCVALQIALGKAELPVDQLTLLRKSVVPSSSSSSWKHRGLFREGYGLVRQIDAIQVAREHDMTTEEAIRRISECGPDLIAWIDAANKADNLNIRMKFWSLIHLSRLEYYIMHRKRSRHFRLIFDGTGSNIVALVDAPINTYPLPKVFNPMSNMKAAIALTMRLKEKQIKKKRKSV